MTLNNPYDSRYGFYPFTYQFITCYYFKPRAFLYLSTICLLASIRTLFPNMAGYIDGILRAVIEIGVIKALTSSSGRYSLHGSRPSGITCEFTPFAAM